MASTPPHGLPQFLPTEEDTPYSTPKLRPEARRTPSFSSSSRSNSSDSSSETSSFFFNDESHPTTSLKLMGLGIPFSWEQTPGIPKHSFKKTESSGRRRLLPLPPAGTTTATAKKWRSGQEENSPKKNLTRFKMDPFFAALIECSKDDRDLDHDANNIWKGSNLTDRFGFINMYTSCKKTCAVSESIVYVPRATPHYNLLHHDHRRRRRSS